MAQIEDIKDEDSLEAWLETQPPEVSVWIAARAPLRVFPIFRNWGQNIPEPRKDDMTILPDLRFYLTSAVARTIPTTDVMHARVNALADARANARRFFNASAITIAGTNAIATASAIAVANSIDNALAIDIFWDSVRTDCEAVASDANLEQLPLWAGENPLLPKWETLKSRLPVATASRSAESARGAVDVDWGFWVKWYDDILAGNEPNWEMYKEIALIDDAVWEKGARVVNDAIGVIVERYALKATPYGETITFDGAYHALARSDFPAKTLADAQARITDVIEDLRRAENQFVDLRDEVELLTKYISRYPDRPIRLTEGCQKVLRHLGDYVAAGKSIEHNGIMGDAMDDLQNTIDDINAFDAEAKKVNDAREAARWGRLNADEKENVRMVADAVAKASDEMLSDEIIEDIEEVMQEGDPEGESKPARYRLGSRLVRVMVLGGAGIALLSQIEPAISGAKFIWAVIRPLIGF